MELKSLSDAAKATNASCAQIERMIASDVLRPSRRAAAQGSPHGFGRIDLLVIGLALVLLRQGWSLASIAGTTDWIHGQVDFLEESLAEGRTHLLVTTFQGAAPRLVEARDLGLFAGALTKAYEAGHGVAVIDLAMYLSRVDQYMACGVTA